MSDDFLTMGLQEDRYLKALRLADAFEDQIEAKLREFDQQMVDKHPELFETVANLSVGSNRTSSSAFAYHRINRPMNGPQAPSSDTQKLNVHLYWMKPSDYGRTDIDGAIRAFGYKIKNADPNTDKFVVEETKKGDWELDISDNPYDSNMVFYRDVDSMAEIDEAIEVLLDHFSTFGSEYAASTGN